MKARIKITLKNGVLDPQGKAIEGAIKGLGISGVGDVRQGKYIEVDLSESDPAKAKAIVEQMCKDLLANTVIENYSYEIGGAMAPRLRMTLALVALWPWPALSEPASVP